jgi:hypothetical protein
MTGGHAYDVTGVTPRSAASIVGNNSHVLRTTLAVGGCSLGARLGDARETLHGRRLPARIARYSRPVDGGQTQSSGAEVESSGENFSSYSSRLRASCASRCSSESRVTGCRGVRHPLVTCGGRKRLGTLEAAMFASNQGGCGSVGLACARRPGALSFYRAWQEVAAAANW